MICRLFCASVRLSLVLPGSFREGLEVDLLGEGPPRNADGGQRADDGVREVRAEEVEARNLGVEGVSFFTIAGRLAVSGAHEPDTFLEAFEELAKASPGR